MLRGNGLAKLDGKGRLKLPSTYRSVIEPTYGAEFFVTSLRGESVLIYPMPVYSGIEERLFRASKVEPVVKRLRRAFNYYGQPATMDGQGRILIHPLLRDSASIQGEVAVIGQLDYLEVWNRETFEKQLREDPLTDSDLKELATLGF
jgi:MraZ protein